MNLTKVPGWWILPLVVGVVMGVVIYNVTDLSAKKKRVVREWDYGKYSVGKCVFGVLPVPIRNCLGSTYGQPCKESSRHREDFHLALEIWKKGLGEQAYKEVIAVREDNKKPFIGIYANTAKQEAMDQVCAPVYRDLDSFLQSNTFGVTIFPNRPGYPDSRVVVCLNKYDKAVAMWRTKVRDDLKRFGMRGILAHEIGHLLIGPNHVKHFGMLMSPEPLVAEVAETTKKIVEQSITACSKRGQR